MINIFKIRSPRQSHAQAEYNIRTGQELHPPAPPRLCPCRSHTCPCKQGVCVKVILRHLQQSPDPLPDTTQSSTTNRKRAHIPQCLVELRCGVCPMLSLHFLPHQARLQIDPHRTLLRRIGMLQVVCVFPQSKGHATSPTSLPRSFLFLPCYVVPVQPWPG